MIDESVPEAEQLVCEIKLGDGNHSNFHNHAALQNHGTSRNHATIHSHGTLQNHRPVLSHEVVQNHGSLPHPGSAKNQRNINYNNCPKSISNHSNHIIHNNLNDIKLYAQETPNHR